MNEEKPVSNKQKKRADSVGIYHCPGNKRGVERCPLLPKLSEVAKARAITLHTNKLCKWQSNITHKLVRNT